MKKKIFAAAAVLTLGLPVCAGAQVSQLKIELAENEVVAEAYADRAVVERRELQSEYGVKNQDGWIIKPQFIWIGEFSQGLAPAQKFAGSNTGYINESGEYVIDPVYDSATAFSGGLAVVIKDGRCAIIDKTGRIVKLLDEWNYARTFSDGVTIVDKPDGKSAIMDTDFNETELDSSYLYVDDFHEGLAVVSTDDGKIVIDKSGKKVFALDCDAYDLGGFKDGKLLACNKDEVCLVNPDGSMTKAHADGSVGGQRMEKDVNIVWKEEGGCRIFNDALEETGALDSSGILQDNWYYKDNVLTVYTSPEKTEPDKYYETEYSFPETGEEKFDVVLKAGDTRVIDDEGKMRLAKSNMGNYITSPAYAVEIDNGRMMIPRSTVWLLGYSEYDAENGVEVSNGEKSVRLTMGEHAAAVTSYDFAGKKYIESAAETDAAAKMISGEIYLPLRFVAEQLGAKVYYNNGIVQVTNGEPQDSGALEQRFAKAKFSLSDYPKIDGSTATLPLMKALAAKMLDIDPDEAENIVYQSRTEAAYEKLINGEVDMIISGTPNEERIKKAAEKGVEFEYYVFAKDAFVFMVNKANPIDNMSVSQVQDIYQGKITNWSEVGGNDAQIAAFQRNETSGSQSIMRNKFMKGLTLMEPKIERINAMGEIVDMISEYDNAENSIGYTVYYYIHDMYGNDDVKVIALDGVEPNAENIRSGAYPYVIDYAAVIRKDEPENSPVRQILEYLKSDDGKQLVAENNFTSVN